MIHYHVIGFDPWAKTYNMIKKSKYSVTSVEIKTHNRYDFKRLKQLDHVSRNSSS